MFDDLFSRSGLTLDRLRNFLEMAQSGGIAKAAPGDANRQSQISRQIRELEEFFGTELTRRRGKSLSLSPAGTRLAGLIHAQLQDLDDFRLEQAQERQARTFTFGTGGSMMEWLLVPALDRIAGLMGNVTLSTVSYRSQALAEAVRDGRVDFAIVRQDAIPAGSPCLELMKLEFLLCIPRRLLKRGTTAREAADPKVWETLPFTAGRDGGQLDSVLRAGMQQAGVDFRPRFECGSLLQARQLIELGACAGVLPSIGARTLDDKEVLILPFAPLKSYGRPLVLHWNPRLLSRRGLDERDMRAMVKVIKNG